MSLSVNFNSTSVRTHRNLVTADRALGVSLDRLSSGLRIQRASDDPSSLVLANQLRYHISGLDRAAANAEEGVTMLQTADGAMDEINGLLNRMRALALSAANESTQDGFSLQALQDEMDSAVASVTRIAGSTRFGSLSLLDGTLGGNQLSPEGRDYLQDVDYESSLTPGGILPGSRLSVILDPAGLTVTRDRVGMALTIGGLPADRDAPLLSTDQYSALPLPRTLAISGPGGSYSIPIDTTTTISDLVAQVDAVRTTYGVQAGYDADSGMLTVESQRFGASGLTVEDITGLGGPGILDDDDTVPGNTLVVPAANQTVDLTYTDVGGTLRTLTLTQDPTQDGGRTFTNLLGGPESAPPYTAFAPGAFRVTLKDDTGGERGVDIAVPWSTEYYANRVSSVAIQSGDLASDRIPVDIPDMRAAALGRTANLTGVGLSSLESLANAKVLITGQASDALRVIDAAITEVTSVRGRVGAIQSNAIEATLSTLRTGLENLASAESQLRDTDFAQESAEFARNQVIYQAATAMLAQANQIPQRIVDLLRG